MFADMLLAVVVILYVCVLLALSFFGNRDAVHTDYFNAGRSSNWFAVAFGMVGATISGISVVSVPGMVGRQSMTYMVMVVGFFFGYVAVAKILLPVFYRAGATSIYEYLERRFGRSSHISGASVFLLYKVLGSSVKMFVVMVVLDRLLFSRFGLPFEVSSLLVMAVIFAYTAGCGIRTVVLTDCVQTALLVVSVVLLMVGAVEFMPNGIDPISAVWQSGYSDMIVADDWASPLHFVKLFVSGVFIVVVMTGLDQDVMQKNLTCRSLADAQKNMMVCGAMFMPVNLLLLWLGAVLLIGAEARGVALPEMADGIVPMFAERFGDVSTCCLCIAMMSASFSSADSAIIGMTTSYFIDIRGKRADEIGETRRKIVQAVFTLCVYLAVCILWRMGGRESAINAIYTIVSVLFAPLLGMFAVGIYSKARFDERKIPWFVLLTLAFTLFLKLKALDAFGYSFGYELLLAGALFFILSVFCFGRE